MTTQPDGKDHALPDDASVTSEPICLPCRQAPGGRCPAHNAAPAGHESQAPWDLRPDEVRAAPGASPAAPSARDVLVQTFMRHVNPRIGQLRDADGAGGASGVVLALLARSFYDAADDYLSASREAPATEADSSAHVDRSHVTPAEAPCAATNPDYPGEYACTYPSGHGSIVHAEPGGETVRCDHAAPEVGAYWNMPERDDPWERTGAFADFPNPERPATWHAREDGAGLVRAARDRQD